MLNAPRKDLGWWPEQWVLSDFVKLHHCFAWFWRQTNIKISWDLDTISVSNSLNESFNESSWTWCTSLKLHCRELNKFRGEFVLDLKSGWIMDGMGFGPFDWLGCFIHCRAFHFNKCWREGCQNGSQEWLTGMAYRNGCIVFGKSKQW